MLELENLTVLLDRLTILRGLNLRVPTGTTVGLVGRNGAGKTTTLRSIVGLAPASGGDIRLDGERIERMPPHRRARLGIGYLPEDRRLIGALSVEENLRVPAEALDIEAPAARIGQVYEWLPELKELASRKALQLSGGQQKLAALGRSFVYGTRVLLLDEPFEGVSTALSRRLANVIRQYQETQPGLSILVAESDFKRAAMLSERAYIIERGEIAEETAVTAAARASSPKR